MTCQQVESGLMGHDRNEMKMGKTSKNDRMTGEEERKEELRRRAK